MHSLMFEATRRPDWLSRFEAVIKGNRTSAFEWGSRDCVTLFCDVSIAITDCDPFHDVQRWTSEASAVKAMLRAGYLSVQAALDDRLPKIEPSEARRGDCGYAQNVGTLNGPFIVTGPTAMQRSATGWVIIPISMLSTAYRIG